MKGGASLTERAKGLALGLGFDLVGVCDARPSAQSEALRGWLAQGFGGCMDYLAKRVEERVDPRRVLPGARSLLSVGLVYAGGSAGEEASPRVAGAAEARGQISRYAVGDDYHEVMRDRLRGLSAALEVLAERPLHSRAYVDTGPVSERVAAARGGLGWIGKNTCLIHTRLGSYLFLGVLITDLALEPDRPESDHCGSCRACLDACPTDAFPSPYVLDARRCIAYTTIEDPGPIPAELRASHEDRVFGCDRCQEVCPWNTRGGRRAPADPLGLRARLAPRSEWAQPSLAWLLGLDDAAWRNVTRRSALRRSKRRGLLRNALVAAGNSGDASLRPTLEAHASGDDPLLAEHARWALERLEERAR
ncbi:MAG: tRNA epoxyqueuosine(34) reductase QueG [Deltaproteobacteria bacterium]|nr:tRNA epoxyqueuosine(34) reductase QueG [Deltaproteobacteria bacterium]MBW2419891.1 tRNA epoxyqueuosine(34) reductase QueG [Deltaproteobacteria bacterium]